MSPPYPVNLVVEGRPCLVVGGGVVASRKVEGLVASGAVVHVVAPEVGHEIRRQPRVTWDERPYRSSDLEGRRLVIAATDDRRINEAVYRDAEAAGVWVNGADDPDHCSFTLPSVVRRGSLMIAVSTGGRSPALARWLRERLERDIGPEYEVLLDLLAAERASLKAAGRSTEGLDWRSALDSDMLGLIRSGDVTHARERLQTCLSSSSG
ncbi:MAG: bifunctional precorrin-2 dehydrogenase/sirohydrochlorin ferrochelatase [Acidimicrobiales bacterium]|nr:bifunctional precorrin-2 dehydrogenase/sirohydrochlorin ferrochelatase [Actinomycetota bacterium]